MRIDWSTARVVDAKLSVQLEGERPRGWKERFKRTVRLLGSGEWGEVRLRKGEVHISAVIPGTEPKLRHFLEGVVEQANVVGRDRDDQTDSPEDDPPGNDEDAEMTRTFRSFADVEGPPADEED